MTLNNMNSLFVDQLSDLYSAEKQLVSALPKMANAAHSDKLRTAFQEHLEETNHHVERLSNIFSELGESPTGKTCKAMKGLIEEGDEVIQEQGDQDVIDAALIAAAQRVEHYEIAGYGVARTFAKELGYEGIARTLQSTLDEEGAADKKLTQIAEGGLFSKGINERATNSR
jgi:ferritin-like metal-binding protein YciE